jgi:pimeloyl-ACP methyl ester carboxylesterase
MHPQRHQLRTQRERPVPLLPVERGDRPLASGCAGVESGPEPACGSQRVGRARGMVLESDQGRSRLARPYVFAVDLPLTGLDDDAAALRRALDAWGRDAVLVGHSYAGLVISKAATERPDVQHLVYVAARLVDGGDVYLKRMSEFPAAPINDEVELTADGNFVVRAETAVRCFYNECARGEAEDAARRLRADGGRLRGRADRRRTVEVDPVDLRAVRTRSRHPPGLSEMDVHSSWRGRDA